MRAARRLGGFLLLAIASLAALARPAAADEASDKEACVASYDRAQRLRIAGDLPGARDELKACSQQTCPDLVQKDCLGWLREVEAAIPTVIVTARTAAGEDRSDVRVFVDGRLVQERLSGAAIEVRAGERLFHFEPARGRAIDTKVVVVAGEKNRVVRVALPQAAERAASAGARGALGSYLPPAIVGTLGLAAGSIGLYLDLSGSSRLQTLRDTCAGACTQSQVDAIRTRMIVGDSLVGVGVVAIGVAVVLLVTRSHGTDHASP